MVKELGKINDKKKWQKSINSIIREYGVGYVAVYFNRYCDYIKRIQINEILLARLDVGQKTYVQKVPLILFSNVHV